MHRCAARCHSRANGPASGGRSWCIRESARRGYCLPTRPSRQGPSILNPYYRIDIEDDRTGIDEIYEQGLLYNFKIGYLNKLWDFNDVASGQLVPSTIDGYDYLQCSNCTFAGNVPKEAKEYIYNKLLSGIRIQKFSAMQ